MECKKCLSLLSEFLDGELNARKTYAVERHVRTCADCRKHFRMLQELREDIHSLLEAPVPMEAADLWRMQVRREARRSSQMVQAPAGTQHARTGEIREYGITHGMRAKNPAQPRLLIKLSRIAAAAVLVLGFATIGYGALQHTRGGYVLPQHSPDIIATKQATDSTNQTASPEASAYTQEDADAAHMQPANQVEAQADITGDEQTNSEQQGDQEAVMGARTMMQINEQDGTQMHAAGNSTQTDEEFAADDTDIQALDIIMSSPNDGLSGGLDDGVSGSTADGMAATAQPERATAAPKTDISAIAGNGSHASNLSGAAAYDARIIICIGAAMAITAVLWLALVKPKPKYKRRGS